MSSSSQLSTKNPKPTPGVYTYVAQWPVYSLAWSYGRSGRLAIGSVLEDYLNKVEIVQFNPNTSDFTPDHRLIFDHPYAPTNIMFLPSEDTSNPDLVATSGDFLRVWDIKPDRVELRALLKGSGNMGMVTSFDWAEFELGRVVACSVDTTCTIWDVENGVVDSQMVAHEKEVYDVSWGGPNVFASVSGDGSVRVFDLRDKERSTIVYENTGHGSEETKPLLRLEWDKADPRFMGTVGLDSSRVVILDIRSPMNPLMELDRHQGSVNAFSWGPLGKHICSVGDDSRALIWNIGQGVEPERLFGSMAEINNVRWSTVDSDWIGITLLNKLQVLRV